MIKGTAELSWHNEHFQARLVPSRLVWPLSAVARISDYSHKMAGEAHTGMPIFLPTHARRHECGGQENYCKWSLKVSLLLKISQSIKTGLIIWNEVDRIPIIIHFGDLSSEKRAEGRARAQFSPHYWGLNDPRLNLLWSDMRRWRICQYLSRNYQFEDRLRSPI